MTGPYREGSATSAPLPVSREHLLAWSVVVALAGACAFFGPMLALRVVAPILTVFGAGGVPMLAVLFLQVVLAPAFTIAFVLGRGRKIPLPPLLAFGVLPAVIGALTAGTSARDLADTLTRAAVSVLARGRLASQGFAELECLNLYGAAVSAGLAAVLLAAGVAQLATIDRGRARAPAGPVSVTMAVGVAWFLLGFAVRAAHRVSFTTAPMLFASLAIPLAVVALAAVATWRAPALAAAQDPQESVHVALSLVTAAAAAIALVFFVDRAALAALEIQMFRALSVLDAPDVRAAALQQLLAARSAHALASTVDVSGCVAAFAAPVFVAMRTLAPASRRGRSMLAGAGVAFASLLGCGLILFVAQLGLARARVRIALHQEVPAQISLPRVPRETRGRPGPPMAGGRVVLTQPVTPRFNDDDDVEVAIDRERPFAELVKSLVALRSPYGDDRRVALVVTPDPAVDVTSLGDFAAFAGPAEILLGVKLVNRGGTPMQPLDVILDDAPRARVAVERGGVVALSLPLSIGGDEDVNDVLIAYGDFTTGSTPVRAVRIFPRATDTTERVARVVAAFTRVFAAMSGVPTPSLELWLGPPVEAPWRPAPRPQVLRPKRHADRQPLQ